VLAAAGRAPEAVVALRRATQLDRDNAQAWRALGDLLFQEGDSWSAEAAYAQHRRALVREPHLKPAARAICDGQLPEAEQMLRAILVVDPRDAPALHMLAEVLINQAVYLDAERLLAHCLELEPNFDGARFNLAKALFHQQKAAQALPHIERLLAARPDEPAYRNLAAACQEQVGAFDRALALYAASLATHPKQALLWLNYGHILRTVARRVESGAAYRRAIALDPALGEAYLGLANLMAPFTDGDIGAMRREASKPQLGRRDRAYLNFALGRALEDAGDIAAAFAAFAAGAALRRADSPYDANAFTRYVDKCCALYSAEFFAARREFGAGAADPIFIIGLHRSGSTLIEQILASHSAVEGTLELPDIGFVARGLGWSDANDAASTYPGSTDLMDAARATTLGEGYIDATRMHRPLGRPFFIDKMPNNFQHLGLMQLILPRAKIIDARRHPLGACLSAFKQHFADAQPFTYDLADLGRYYRNYVALMDHFDAALPGRVHRLIYEDLVEDTEGEVRRLLAYCGLEYEPACLSFYENNRAVRTVSSEQVRRPIFREGVEQWRRYEPWLGSLKDALGPALEGWRGG
jgi:tetratricopeptide (TPR) repeat protein